MSGRFVGVVLRWIWSVQHAASHEQLQTRDGVNELMTPHPAPRDGQDLSDRAALDAQLRVRESSSERTASQALRWCLGKYRSRYLQGQKTTPEDDVAPSTAMRNQRGGPKRALFARPVSHMAISISCLHVRSAERECFRARIPPLRSAP